MLEYLDATTKMTMHQIFNGFVIIFLLALILRLFCKIGHGHRDETRRICRLSAA